MADSLAKYRRAVGAEGSRERHTVEEEDSLGAGSRSGEGIGDATLVVAVVVVDCSLEPGMENVSVVVGADCNQAEGCLYKELATSACQEHIAGGLRHSWDLHLCWNGGGRPPGGGWP